MFRIYLIISLSICFFISTQAQTLFSTGNLEQALPLASAQKKMIFVQLEAKECKQCNEVADVAFSNNQLQEQINTSFISVKIQPGSKQWKQYANRYQTLNGGISLFLDEAGTLVHRYNGTSSSPSSYLQQISIALSRKHSGSTLRLLENDYKSGERNSGVLESLLLARNRVGLETDSLLDEYVKDLPPDSLRTKKTILFIARMSPILGSVADKALRKNGDFFNQCWFSISSDQRVAINNNIIRKSKQAAINSQDINAAYLVATFARSTYYDIYNAQRIYDQTMIEYFREAEDTLKYIPMAVYYYDTYFMSVSVDSIQLADSLKIREGVSRSIRDTSSRSANVTTIRTTVAVNPVSQQYANQLRNAAWSFYIITKDSAALSRGLNWAKRANEFYPAGNNMDVYARLLYHFGSAEDAIALELQAIADLQKKGMQTQEQEEILRKMKKGDKQIDSYF